MNARTVFFALVVAGAGYYFWNQHQETIEQQAIADSADASGFIQLPATVGVDPDKVLILAAPNCPKAGAQRAEALAEALAERGIPYVQSGHIQFRATPGQRFDKRRLDSVMLGPTPVVLIHGRGKSNPSVDDVVAEYVRGGA